MSKRQPRARVPINVVPDVFQGPIYTPRDVQTIIAAAGLPPVADAEEWLARELRACAIYYVANRQADAKETPRPKANEPWREYIFDLARAYARVFDCEIPRTRGGPLHRFVSEALKIVGYKEIGKDQLRDVIRAKQPSGDF